MSAILAGGVAGGQDDHVKRVSDIDCLVGVQDHGGVTSESTARLDHIDISSRTQALATSDTRLVCVNWGPAC